MVFEKVKYKIGGKGPIRSIVLVTITGQDPSRSPLDPSGIRVVTRVLKTKEGSRIWVRIQTKSSGTWRTGFTDNLVGDTFTPEIRDEIFRLFRAHARPRGFTDAHVDEARKRVEKKLSADGSLGGGAVGTVQVPDQLVLHGRGKKTIFVDFDLIGSGIAVVKRGDPSSAAGRADATVLQRVPIDNRGNISKMGAQVHFLNDLGMSGATRRGKFIERKPAIDVQIQASKVAPLKSNEKDSVKKKEGMLQQWEWWFAPNEGDIDTVDTKGSAGELGPRIIITGSPVAQKNVVEILKNNFTVKERKIMQEKGLIIEVGAKLRRGIAGVYRSGSGGGGFDLIQIGSDNFLVKSSGEIPKSGPLKGKSLDDNTLTHEVIHFLRNRDPRRDTITRKAADFNTPKDRDLEETFTDAETTARMRTGVDNKGQEAGYYSKIPFDKFPEGVADRNAAAAHDKMLLMGNSKGNKGKEPSGSPNTVRALTRAQRFRDVSNLEVREASIEAGFPTIREGTRAFDNQWKGRKGLAAVKATNKAFPNTTIARAGIHTQSEAVDTYWRYKTDIGRGQKITVYTHIYSPKGNLDLVKARQVAQVGAPGGELVRFEDGKEVVLREAVKTKASMGRGKKRI